MTRLMILLIVLFAAVGSFAQQPQAPQQPPHTAPQGAPQAGTPLTLAQAEATALRNNPQITIAGETYNIAADGNLMPTRKGQAPPSSKYFDQGPR